MGCAGHMLAGQIGVTGYVLEENLDGIGHEESLVHPPTGGSSLNWVVGHMADARNKLHMAVTGEPVFPPDRLAAYEGRPDSTYSAETAADFEEVKSRCDQAGQALIDVLSAMDDEALDRPAPFSVVGNADETIGSLAATFTFHDAYHAGQTGILRRINGHEGVLTPPEPPA